MKNLFIFLFLGVFAWASLILWDSPPEFFLRDKKTSKVALPQADSYMLTIQTSKYDESGVRAYLLQADTALYFQKQDRFQLTSPELTARKSTIDAAPWRLTAELASSTERGEQMFLSGQVHAWQNTAKGKNEIYTTDITFIPGINQAATSSPVELVSPEGVTTATGMEADFDNRQFRLSSNVESMFYGR